MLQGLSAVGPVLAHRLLLQFGSVERVITASAAELRQVRGVGPKRKTVDEPAGISTGFFVCV
jgi:ERCC4-type nuclease